MGEDDGDEDDGDDDYGVVDDFGGAEEDDKLINRHACVAHNSKQHPCKT